MVTTSPRSWLRHQLRKAFGSRAGERGSAIFIVLMVLTILTAIGVFATQSAGLNQRTSGYSRQSTQTGYVADYAILAGMDEANTAPADYLQKMVSGQDSCVANMYIDAGAGDRPACYRLYAEELQKRLQQAGNNALLFDPDGGSLGPGPPYVATQQPGSPTADFVAELTDPDEAGPVAGADLGGGTVKLKYAQVTITGMGQVRPTSASKQQCVNAEDKYSAQSAGNRTTRARVKIGPY